jgi:hypothetical protein
VSPARSSGREQAEADEHVPREGSSATRPARGGRAACAGGGSLFAADSDFLNAHADALLDLAEVLELAGRSDEGIPAIELCEEKGNTVSAQKARTRLASASTVA